MIKIDPKQIYSISQVCTMIPSRNKGRPHLGRAAVHLLRKRGELEMIEVKARSRSWYFVLGAALIKFLEDRGYLEPELTVEERARRVGLLP